ncbi:MAG: hypothetical protein IJW64_04350 [Clostridia bacterium]|nr:hypothetical protein [Clostridia bacterium]
MIKTAKEIAFAGITVALLIGGQLALSAVSGVEIVTAIFAVYCFVFGVLNGVIVATAFSLIRCFIFGFFPQVILLYLIYYNLFAVAVGVLGAMVKDKKVWFKILVLTVCSAVLTVLFTLIDNLLNVLLFSLSSSAANIYFVQSIPVMVSQVVCVSVTVPLFFYPLEKIFLLSKTK